MARKYQWSAAKYRAIVRGDAQQGIPSLRSVIYGFESKDGFNVNQVESWTPYQRRKVREAFHKLEVIQAQPKRMVRAKGENLRKLQDAFHGGISSKNFKVAFIPDTEPRLTLPGAKKRPPKLRILKEGISISRPSYERLFIPFNQRSLVRNARGEVKRAIDAMPKGTRLFHVQVGEYQTVNGSGPISIMAMILDWMNKYDGKKALPDSSGNKGDSPKHHHWKYWLNGLVGYKGAKHVSLAKLGRIIYKGRKHNVELTDQRKRFMRRKGARGKK